MADRCSGCTNKFKFREKTSVCAKCRRNFCSICIPPAKHKKHKKDPSQPVRNTCVYCTRKLQDALKAQEIEVLENFPQRFYHSPHLSAPVQSKVQLDADKLRAASANAGRAPHQPLMTEEDRKLEERLRKLKESHKPRTTVSSEEELQGRLAKLRDETDPTKHMEKTSPQPPPVVGAAKSDSKSMDSGNNPSTSGTGLLGPQPNQTQAQQADDLLGQLAERVKLDSRLEQADCLREDELRSRFQALTGKKLSSGTDHSPHPEPHDQHLEDSIHKFLRGLEVNIENEDPEKLLEDFKRFHAQEKLEALTDVTSPYIQAIVEHAKELHQEGEEKGKDPSSVHITPYPQIPPSEREGERSGKGISEAEISNVLETAENEMAEEARERKEIDMFVSDTSHRLGRLRGEEEKEEEENVVRSKLDPRRGPEQVGLDFSWGHFGPDGKAYFGASGSRGNTAARQLGITLSGDSLYMLVDSDEVEDLVKRMTAEAALDSKLEEKGLDHYLEPPSGGSQGTSFQQGKQGGATATGSSGASAAIHSIPGRWGESDDLPWCCICNADAQIQCYDCDDDLYCMQCFSEGHEQFGLFDHKYTPFEPHSSTAV